MHTAAAATNHYVYMKKVLKAEEDSSENKTILYSVAYSMTSFNKTRLTPPNTKRCTLYPARKSLLLLLLAKKIKRGPCSQSTYPTGRTILL